MKNTKKNQGKSCLNFLHLSMFVFCTLLSVDALAFKSNNHQRKPASSFLDEEIFVTPDQSKTFMQVALADDDGGVMSGMRSSLSSWADTEEFAHTWNLESTGLYKTPTANEKGKMINSRLLKYVDKRLAGELKNAEEGSVLHTAKKVETTLRPNAEVAVSKLVSIKFKARVLQGKIIMDVKNPFVECNASVSAKGKVNLITKKEFKDWGLATGAEYRIDESQWVAYADQEITKELRARISSTQSDKQMMFNKASEQRFEMLASFPFNL